MSIKKAKTPLQQLMGGTSDIKEAFTFPGMSNLYSSDSTDNTQTPPVTGTLSTTPATPATPATRATPAVNAIGSTPSVDTPGTTRQTSNTNAVMMETQNTTTTSILVFIIHVIFAVIIAYIWGILGSNALFLMTRSPKEKDYIFPTNRYDMPYCNTKDLDKSYFSYGFPYNLMPRDCSSSEDTRGVITMEKQNIYLTDKALEGGVGNGVSQALFNYIFNSVFGGLGQGARSFSQAFLNLFDTTDTGKGYDQDSWDNMKAAGGRKLLIFILFPLIIIYFIPILGFIAAIMGLIFGIISDHPFWGIIFTLFFGFFIAIGNGIWAAIQSFYIFCLYPCLNIKNKDKYNKIFDDVRPYMLFVFYVLIAFYAFQDLGNSGGAGIIFFIIIAYFTGNAG
jgi:hypothetical protein